MKRRSVGSIFRGIIRRMRLLWRLMWDRRIRFTLKMIPLGSLLYLGSPIDLVFDFFPIVGIIEDIVIVLLGFRLFLLLCPRRIIEEHLYDMDSLSASYRVKEEKPKSEFRGYIEASSKVSPGKQASDSPAPENRRNKDSPRG